VVSEPEESNAYLLPTTYDLLSMNFRPLRVSNVIRDELGKMILREIEFPTGWLCTITNVEVDKKLEIARVKVSVLPSSEETAALRILRDRQGELQHFLNRKMRIKPMPRISFEPDHGPENAAAVEKALLEENGDGVEKSEEDQ